MKGLTTLKFERPYLHIAVADRCAARGIMDEWWGIVTWDPVRAALGPHFKRVLGFKEFLDLGGEPTRADIEALERRYGDPTLWTYVIPDRRLYSPAASVYAHNPVYRDFSHDELLRFTGKAFRAAERLLDELSPSFVLLESAGSIDECALHRVAETRDIPVGFIQHTRVANYWFLTRSARSLSTELTRIATGLRAGTEPPPTAAESELVRDVRDALNRPAFVSSSQKIAQDLMSNLARISPRNVLRGPGRIARAVMKSRREGRDNPYVASPMRALPDRVLTRVRLLRDTKLIEWQEPEPDEPFVYFPLQMQPEVTSTVWAPSYMDQVSLVELVARSIPIHWKLYVKEHPIMLGRRPTSYYKRLLGLPTVRMIRPGYPSRTLVKQAELTMSVTGTSPFEGAVLGRRGIMFGETSFDGIRHLARFDRELSELPRFIRRVHAEDVAGRFDVDQYIVASSRWGFRGDSFGFANTPEQVPAHEAELLVDRITDLLRHPARYT